MNKSTKNNKNNIKFVKKTKRKKLILKTIYFLLILGIAYNIIYLVSSKIHKTNYMELFGTSLLQMKTSYMEKDLSKNDLVIVKKPNKNQLIVGNIIAYKVNNKIRIDKIYKIIESKGAEETIYVTKSNKSLYPNKEHIKESQIIGKKVLSFPILGLIIGFLQTKVATFLTLSFLLLILSYVRYKEIRYRERKRKKAGNLK